MNEAVSWALVGVLYFCCLSVVGISLVVGFKKNWHRFRDTTATHLTWSPLVPWYVLFLYRFAIVCISFILWAVVLYYADGWSFLQYYTIWNSFLVIWYFVFLSCIQAVHHHWGVSDSVILFVGNAAVVFFNVLISAIYLSLVFGLGFLLPKQEINTESDSQPNYTFVITAFSAIFMIIEFVLNNVPMRKFHANFMVLWAVIYSFYAWTVFIITEDWIYSFLNVPDNSWAVIAYLGLLCLHVIIFFVAYGLWTLKQKFLQKFKPGYEATFEQILPYEVSFSGENDARRSFQRYTSQEESFYTATQQLQSS